MKRLVYILSAAIVLLAGALGYGYIKYKNLALEYADTKQNLEQNLNDLTGKNAYLSNQLQVEQEKTNAFQEQITGIASTVNQLNKLSKTDKELLQKYSKVYFLNENYVPESLAQVPFDYTYDRNKIVEVHSRVLGFMEDMMTAAKNAGSPLLVISGYRSFGEQASLKVSYKMTYGSGANSFSADQGFSEHQLGTAVDFTTPDLGSDFSNFKTTNAYKWLQANAYKYGFVLSYPEGNSYYVFEPWHWRFVGKALALMLHEENKNFYDVDQRDIDNYLINIFD